MLKKRLLSSIAALLLLIGGGSVGLWASQVQGTEESSSTTEPLPEPETTQTLTNGAYQLDFASSNLSFVWTNTATHESLHSGRRYTNDGLNGATWRGLMADGLTIGFRNDSRNQMKPYSSLGGSTSVTVLGTTLKAVITISKLGLTLEMDLTLNDDGTLDLKIPFASIAETAKDEAEAKNRYQLSYILPYLGLGDAFGLQQKGAFLFVPDGCGALADLSVATIASQTYDHRVAGLDLGLLGNNGALRIASASPEKNILLPVSGLAYPDRAGMFYAIKGGAPYCDIDASVTGIGNNGYSYSAPRFNYREEYFQYVDKAGNGKNSYLETPYQYDAALRYQFLPSGSSLGTMASLYRAQLEKEGLLKQEKREAPSYRLEWLMADSRKSIFGQNEIVMATPEKINDAVTELAKSGLSEGKLAFKAYQQGGYSNSSLSSFGWAGGAKTSAYETLAGKASDMSFDFDYRLPRTSSRGYGQSDIAMSVSSQAIYTFDPDTYNATASTKDRVMLSLKKSQAKLNQDKAVLGGITKAGFQVSDCTNTVFSSYSSYEANRAQSLEDIVGLYEGTSLPFDAKMPEERWLKEARDLTDLDWESSSYYLAPQSVPFYQMVTSGAYGLYSKSLNLAYEEDVALRLIEADTRPSFLLTNEDSINLYGASASFVFSSQFSAWKDKIVALVKTVNAALDPFNGAQMTSYERLSATLVKESYDNGKGLLINRGTAEATDGTRTVPAQSYLIF